MKSLRIITLLLLSTLLLTSCFWGKDTTKTVSNPPVENRVENSPQVVEQAITEQQRITKLDALTSENLSTQIETKDGKKVLKNRRLFINYFKAEKVDTSAELISALGKVEKFAKGEWVELDDSDILVMIAGSQIENPNWNVCGNFNATKKGLDSKNKYYAYINDFCNPPAPPQPSK